MDDIDTDKESQDQEQIDKNWARIGQDLFPTMSISGTKRFLVVENIFTKDSDIVKASLVADDYEAINILDKLDKPSRKECYRLADVLYMLSKSNYAS